MLGDDAFETFRDLMISIASGFVVEQARRPISPSFSDRWTSIR
jgi:hypothetical protein